jgi:catechol 2,3-dioxygenase-like lactoylglutathione lyase family enzyme
MDVDYVMHFGICVRDLERSIRFYREGLGFVEKGRLHVEDAPTAQMMGIEGLGCSPTRRTAPSARPRRAR